MSKKEELALEVPPKNTALAVPEYLQGYKGDKTGTDHITKEDMKMPRLNIAQKMSHQVDEDDAAYIADLKFGQLFNDLTGTVYEAPLYFTVVRADAPRAIEFRPIEEGGGVIDLNVPINDPRTKWHGEDKPTATVFYDYYIMLLDHDYEIVALSLKTTNIKVAKRLNSLMKLRFGPPFTQRYVLNVSIEENSKGKYGVFTVNNAGPVSEEALKLSAGSYENLKDRKDLIKHDGVETVDAEPVEEKLAF